MEKIDIFACLVSPTGEMELELREKIGEKNFNIYRELCVREPYQLLGHFQMCRSIDGGLIALVFAENEASYKNAFERLRDYALKPLVSEYGEALICLANLRQKIHAGLKELSENQVSDKLNSFFVDIRLVEKRLQYNIPWDKAKKIGVSKDIKHRDVLERLFADHPVSLQFL